MLISFPVRDFTLTIAVDARMLQKVRISEKLPGT